MSNPEHEYDEVGNSADYNDSQNSEKITKNKVALIDKELILNNPKTSRAVDYKVLPRAAIK
jgi:hypothetical protein